MNAIIKQWTNTAVESIRFLYVKGKNPTEIHHKLVAVYDGHTMSRKEILVWCSAFTEECTNVQDRPHVGCSYSSTTGNKIVC